jgi:hypothetical protein
MYETMDAAGDDRFAACGMKQGEWR